MATNSRCRTKSDHLPLLKVVRPHRQIGKGADICKCRATISPMLKGGNPKGYSESMATNKPCRNIGQPSTLAESSQTDIAKSEQVRPSAFLKMNRPHRLFGSSQIFIRHEKRPHRLADTPKPNRQSRQRGRHRKGDETKSPKSEVRHTETASENRHGVSARPTSAKPNP